MGFQALKSLKSVACQDWRLLCSTGRKSSTAEQRLRLRIRSMSSGGKHKKIGDSSAGDEHCGNKGEIIEAFGGGEHARIGEFIKIDDDVLTLPNGVKIRFEEIISLAGDFYGLPDKPIIDPVDQEDSGRYQRFTDAYNKLARSSKDELQDELENLLATLHKEIESGEEVPAKIWDEITGGIWFGGVPVKPGRMLKLAENNHDHFLPCAKHSYLTGHQLAIKKAQKARKCGREEAKRLLLHEALSMDAFACHFLTDMFASGHIRTPRVELGKGTKLGRDGHLLCKYMHDEDNKFGLRVTNKRGDKWIAFGDGMLLKEKSKDNLRIAVEAVQNSVNQVYEAYRNPGKVLDPAVVIDLVPFVDQEEPNNTPLFQVKDGKLHRRSDVYNLQSKKTTTNWWGPTTAALLLVYDPKNSAI
ncbi:uncharacterized protein [Montipora foliosa]|uniref:uncharacterized protein isoform X2 n=1 Tax=Montipora foliosa TaxID=591990 RepID=UPI0035F1CC92